MNAAHALGARRAVAGRELQSFARQPGRLLSALIFRCVAACAVAFFALALWGYDPQPGAARRPQGGPP